jgi:hypothetical protein
MFKFTISFYGLQNATYNFEFGVDFGLGGALFVNGNWITSRTDDMWWAGDWSSSDVLKFTVDAVAGLTLIEVYGSEGCCDG